MALTPEDVVNKRFNPTKFREGYDQDEVDDFLDEVVVELRRLNQENEEMRQRLVAGQARVDELTRQAQAAPEPVQQAAPLQAMPAPVPDQSAYAPAAFDPNQMDPGNTNNLLQLARRLHEEHVREGMEKRDALIAEGHATAARVVSEAEQGARGQLGLLQQEKQDLEREKQDLERKLDELRIFEREYRTKLKGYIESQLRELESSNAIGAASGQIAVAAAPQAAAPQYTQAVAAPVGYAQPQPEYGAPQPDYGQPQPDYAATPAYGAAQPTDYPGFGSSN